MEFSRCYLFETFVVLTVDQFVVRDDGLLEQQKQKHLLKRLLKKLHISSDFSEKSESSLQRRRSLRN